MASLAERLAAAREADADGRLTTDEIDARVCAVFGELATDLRRELVDIRAELDAVAARLRRWPERMMPAEAAEYLGYASSDSMSKTWKALRHRDPFDNAFFYLRAELDAEMERRAA